MSVNPHTQWWLLAAVLMLSLCSCSHKGEYTDVLVRADSLASANPDSAIAFLRTINPSTLDASSHHYYDLLCIKANDKAYVRHVSDSLVLDVLHYFEGIHDQAMLPEAYYYAGRVTKDLGDAPQAMDYYQKALDAIGLLDADKQHSYRYQHLLSLANCQLGYVLRSQFLFDEAVAHFKVSLSYDSLTHDTVGMSYNYMDIGQSLISHKRFHEASLHFARAEELASAVSDTALFFDALCKETSALLFQDKTDEAMTRFFGNPHKIARRNLAISTYIKAVLYAKTGQRDSASYYFRQLQSVGTLTHRAQANIWFANDALRRSDVNSAYEYLNRQVLYSDSIFKQTESETVGLMHGLYNYKLIEQKKLELQVSNAQYRNFVNSLLFVAIILLLAAAFILYIYFDHKKKSRIQQNRLKYLYAQKEQESEQTIADNQKRIADLQEQLEASNDEYQKIQQELTHLILLNKKADTDRQLSDTFYLRWQQTDAFAALSRKCMDEKPLSEEEWEQLEEQIKLLEPSFLTKLSCTADFSLIEWRVSLLIKLKVKPAKIAILVSRKDSTISSIRQRLYEKVTGHKGSSSDWDAFILNI